MKRENDRKSKIGSDEQVEKTEEKEIEKEQEKDENSRNKEGDKLSKTEVMKHNGKVEKMDDATRKIASEKDNEVKMHVKDSKLKRMRYDV